MWVSPPDISLALVLGLAQLPHLTLLIVLGSLNTNLKGQEAEHRLEEPRA